MEADRLYADAIRQGILPDPAGGRTWTIAASRALRTPVSPSTTVTTDGRGATSRSRAARGDVSELAGGYGGKIRGVGREDPGSEGDGGDGVSRGDGGYGAGGGSRDAHLLWVDLRRAPVDVIPAAMRRVVQVLKAVSDGGDGLVVEWGGRRGSAGEEESGRGARRVRGLNSARAGRREAIIEAFGLVEPALEVAEPSSSRGQVRTARA